MHRALFITSPAFPRRPGLPAALTLAALLTLGGCAASGQHGSGAPGWFGAAPASSGAGAAAAATAAPQPTGLADGIALYNKGDYNGAIRRLAQADVAGPAAPRATQLAALKYSAFSYCLSARQTLCRQQFDKAFKLDAAFDLDAGEHGHPLWEPVFVKAKKSAAPK